MSQNNADRKTRDWKSGTIWIIKKCKGVFYMAKKLSILFLLLFCFLAIPSAETQAASKDTYTVSTNGANLNIRKNPTTQSSVIGRLKNKSSINVTSSSGNWYKISFNGKSGYVSASYVKKSSSSNNSNADNYPQTGYVSNGSVPLRIREQPNTSSQILGTIKRGSATTVTGKINSNWYSVSDHGINGYASAAYITLSGSNQNISNSSNDSDNSNKEKYRSIQLNVPLYMQRDPQWSSVRLGTSGSTIYSSGCTITCLAEVKSYVTGKKITPDIMKEQCDFTKDGYVYWPSAYTPYYNSDCLEKIYQELESGQPVLFGAKKANEKQHWVVVTGYQGDEKKLSASGFLINDPLGYYDTLDEYRKIYTNFYKLMYLKN